MKTAHLTDFGYIGISGNKKSIIEFDEKLLRLGEKQNHKFLDVISRVHHFLWKNRMNLVEIKIEQDK